MGWRGSMFPAVLVTVLWQEGKWAPQSLPGCWEPLRAPRKAPQSSESSCKGQAQLSRVPPWRNKCVEFLQQRWNDCKTSWHYHTHSRNTEPAAVCPTEPVVVDGHVWKALTPSGPGVWFAPQGTWNSPDCPRSWPQHYTVVGVGSTAQDNWTHQQAPVYNPTSPSALSYNLSCLIHTVITYLFLYGPALVHFSASIQHSSPGKWIIRNNKLAFPKTQEIYRKLHTLPYK